MAIERTQGGDRIARRCGLGLAPLLIALWACGPAEPPIRLGFFTWPGYEPFALAEQLGIYRQPVHIVDYASATQVQRAFRNGDIEVAALTLDEVLLLAEDVPEVRVVLVLDVSHGADVILGRPEFASFAELRGRRVGYEATALGAYMLARAQELHGMAPGEVVPVSVQVDEHEAAYRAGRVDAIVTFEPYATRIIAAGARPLFDSSRIPDEIFDVLAVRADTLERRGGAVDDLVRAWFGVLRHIQTHPVDAGGRLAKGLGLHPGVATALYERLPLQGEKENRALLTGQPAGLSAAAVRLMRVMVAHGLLRQEPVAPAALIEPGPFLRVPADEARR